MTDIFVAEPTGKVARGGDGDTFDGQCYAALVEHWAKARIEGPVQVISRYDDAAKLLITLGALFPAILVAAYSSVRQTAQATAQEGLWQPSTLIFGLFLLFFLAFVMCLIMSCKWQVRNKLRGPWQTDAREVCVLLEHAALGTLKPNDITEHIRHWTKALDDLIKYKHMWVQFACICLTVSSTCMMVLLFVTAMGVRLAW